MSATGPAILGIRGVGMVFNGAGGRRPALEDVTFDIGAHDVVGIVGESGCGKTTLLRIMAGLLRPTHGDVSLAGVPIVRPEPQVCLVFQQYTATLLPWRRALDNVLLGMPTRGADGRRLRESAGALLERMGLGADVQRYPWELSGGMQQRVALARALIRRPRVLLLDEPFSAVDERTRASLQELVLTLHRDETCSIVLVTHNLDEVLHLSQRIVVLAGRPGRVQQVIDGPADLSREALRSHLSLIRRRP